MLPFSVYASNYDSDCVVSENQPVKITFTVVLPIVQKIKITLSIPFSKAVTHRSIFS